MLHLCAKSVFFVTFCAILVLNLCWSIQSNPGILMLRTANFINFCVIFVLKTGLHCKLRSDFDLISWIFRMTNAYFMCFLLSFWFRPYVVDLLTTRIFALVTPLTLLRLICNNTGLTRVCMFNSSFQLGLLASSSLTGVYCGSCFNHRKANSVIKSRVITLSNYWFGALKSDRSYWAFCLSLG